MKLPWALVHAWCARLPALAPPACVEIHGLDLCDDRAPSSRSQHFSSSNDRAVVAQLERRHDRPFPINVVGADMTTRDAGESSHRTVDVSAVQVPFYNLTASTAGCSCLEHEPPTKPASAGSSIKSCVPAAAVRHRRGRHVPGTFQHLVRIAATQYDERS